MEVHDADLLAAVPEFISIGGLLKATPSQDGQRRFLYFEASNEDVDHQNEVVLQKALKDSADYYVRHGNVDLEHFSILGPKAGIPDYMTYEIGRPVEVRVDGRRTFVKSELYSGESPLAKSANLVWDSIVHQTPPKAWYPSVGGAVLEKSVKMDPKSGQRIAVIERVRWTNTGLSATPVNKTVPTVSSAPIGTFAKSLNGFVIAKTLTAGYGTDSATLAGGSSLRKQSLDRGPKNYFDLRERLAGAVRSGKLGKQCNAEGMHTYCIKEFGLSHDEAAEHVERFMRDLSMKRSK